MTIIVDGVCQDNHTQLTVGATNVRRTLAVAKGIPQLDGLVTGARHDLSVVGAARLPLSTITPRRQRQRSPEGNGQHVLGVVDEATDRGAVVEVPEARPTARQTRYTKPTSKRDTTRGETP